MIDQLHTDLVSDDAALGIARLADLIGTGNPIGEGLVSSVLGTVVDSLHLDGAVVAMHSGGGFLVAYIEDRCGTGLTRGHRFTLQDQTFVPDEPEFRDLRADSHVAYIQALLLESPAGVRSILCIPLYRSSGVLYGRLVCLSSSPHTPSTGELALLRLAGRILMQVVESVELQRGDAEYARLLDRSRDPIIVVRGGIIVHANQTARAAAEDLGLHSVLDRQLADFLTPDIRLLARSRLALVEQTAASLAPIVYTLESKSGQTYRVEVVPLPVVYQGQPSVQLSIRPVVDDDVSKDEWQRRALHDPLTGLPNRALLEDRLVQALRTAERDHVPLAVLLLDLDGFKQINDRFGHEAGDEVLVNLAPRLRRVLRESDTVARLGGDEFAVVLPGASTADAQMVARKVLGVLRRPFALTAARVTLWASIGVAVYPDQGITGVDLLRHADAAMYEAKHREGGVRLFSPDFDAPMTGALSSDGTHSSRSLPSA